MNAMPTLSPVRSPAPPSRIPGIEVYKLLRQEMARTGWPDLQRIRVGELHLLELFCMSEPVDRFCWAVRPHQSNLIAPRERYRTNAEWMMYGSGQILSHILRLEPEARYYQWRRGFGLERVSDREVFGLFCNPPAPPFKLGTRVRLSRDEDCQLSYSRGNLATVQGMTGPFVNVDVEGRGIRRVLPEFIAPLVTEEALAERYARAS